jgi:Ca-activated chloride channel family protein
VGEEEQRDQNDATSASGSEQQQKQQGGLQGNQQQPEQNRGKQNQRDHQQDSGEQNEQRQGGGSQQGPDEEFASDGGGRQQEKDGSREQDPQQQGAGSSDHRQANGPAREAQPDALDIPEAARRAEAVEEFDQLGEATEMDAEEGGQTPEKSGEDGNGYMALVEQQLNGIEGDPAELLQNRFKLEERRQFQRQNGEVMMYESRPW